MILKTLFYTVVVLLAAVVVSYATAPDRERKGYVPRIVEWFWQVAALIIAWRPIAEWVIKRAQRTPYSHLDGYMMRWWLFNAYSEDSPAPIAWLPSVRVHHILRRDLDRHLHDHPWAARSIILRGFYVEVRQPLPGRTYRRTLTHLKGDTVSFDCTTWHSIIDMPDEGVWTLFFTWRYEQWWGFLVNGRKVHWREYLASKETQQ